IEHEPGVVSRGGEDLEAAWPVGFTNAFGNRLGRDAKISSVMQFHPRRDGQRQVAQLMAANQRGFDHDFGSHHVQRIALPLTAERRPLIMSRRYRRHVGHGVHGARTCIQDCVSDHVVGFGQLRQRYHNAARTNDAGFFAGNLGDGFAQIFLVIERDVGDDAEARFHDIGGIQAAAHAHFEHNHVGAAAREVFKAYGSQHLKKAGVPRQIAFRDEALGGAVDHVMEQGEIVVGDGFAIEANALVDAYQMRRGVEPGPEAGSLQDGRQSRGGGTLAVGARDQHRGKAILGISQRSEQHAHVRQVELVRRRLRQLVAQREHLRDCGFVGQGCRSLFVVRRSRRRLANRVASLSHSLDNLSLDCGGSTSKGFPRAPMREETVLVRTAKSETTNRFYAACTIKSSARAIEGFKFLRTTTASSIPCSSKNSERWNPGGSFCLMVCSITRGPAKPIRAPGSAMLRSPNMANDAVTPPVVGSVRTEIYGTRALSKRASAAEIFASCIRLITPSIMRAPPDAETIMIGVRVSIAFSMARVMASPTTAPMLPPINEYSIELTITGRPFSLPWALMTASFRPVSDFACFRREE